MLKDYHPIAKDYQALNVLALLRQLRQNQTYQHTKLWSSEDSTVFSPDLWVGFMGTATALAAFATNGEALLSIQQLKNLVA
ncbi:MAG: hypothetical protein R2880_13415 [Deinococcales bacterium]